MTDVSIGPTTTASAIAAALSAWREGVGALAGGAFLGALLRSLLAINGVSAPSAATAVGGGAVAALVCVLGAIAVGAARRRVRFGRDALTVEQGLSPGATAVEYDDIDLAIRRDTGGDRRLGTASYELVRSGASNRLLGHLRDPDKVERALDARVPTPRERIGAADEATVREALQRSRVFWRGWPSDEPLPRSAVVADETLVETLDGEEDVTPVRGDEDDERPRRSTPGRDRPATLDGIARRGNTTEAEEFTGGTGGDGVAE
ncbi:hypothetical protein C475_14893 [Halosimplex carlsbadense 2-9-1]|uniref:Uncharacterized protein n=1 Tax=Halosimplex carlsbadense 2-9-1 TaxID=797114 RepID=M0CLS8_9EURY|nr:hypothetical protein [Halosimplex carlsbadense]ELZ23568.1 hypothetical protein C475_14893 [Halosimplex carlsbadense 2-9-1]